MAKAKKTTEDPVVREVRAVRSRLLKEAGGSIEGLIALARSRQSDSKSRVAKRPKGKGPGKKAA